MEKKIFVSNFCRNKLIKPGFNKQEEFKEYRI